MDEANKNHADTSNTICRSELLMLLLLLLLPRSACMPSLTTACKFMIAVLLCFSQGLDQVEGLVTPTIATISPRGFAIKSPPSPYVSSNQWHHHQQQQQQRLLELREGTQDDNRPLQESPQAAAKEVASKESPVVVAEEEEERPEFIPMYTGLNKDCDWELAMPPIPLRTELALLDSGVLWRRGEFGRIPNDSPRFDDIDGKCRELGMTLTQAFLVRKQLLVTKAMTNSWKLVQRYPFIEEQFRTKQRTLLQLSGDLSVPPVNIVRVIVRARVEDAHPELRPRDKKIIVRDVINESNQDNVDTFLESDWEVEQLQIAKDFDVIGYSSQASEIESSKWENAIYEYLTERNINFLTEDDLRDAGAKYTPDCLLLDDVVINGQKVRWIDAKNFYGSGLRESNAMTKKMKKQIDRYEAEFGGSGAVVFKQGFSEKFIQKIFL